MKTNAIIGGCPGEELITRGLSDHAAGRETVESLLVHIGWPRLAAVGLVNGMSAPEVRKPFAEERLYQLLCATHGRNAYAAYNSLLRRLVSFENAMDHRHRRMATKQSED